MTGWYVEEYRNGKLYRVLGPWDKEEASQHYEMMKREEEPGIEYRLTPKG